MKKFPLDKYRFYIQLPNIVIAVSTYAGETITGVAKCAPEDEFSLEKGKDLAAARCNLKVAKKRYKRAQKKTYDATSAITQAIGEYTKNKDYLDDSFDALMDARHELKSLELDM